LIIVALFAVLVASWTSKPIPGKYIFQFQQNSTAEQREAYFTRFLSASSTHKILDIWSFSTFHGFHAETSELFAQKELASNLFRSVEQDMEISIAQSCQTQYTATWGIARVSSPSVNFNSEFYYEHDGSPVDCYIIDTGIQTTHPDFEGRAVWGANFADNTNSDCNGHGTHCAGTVAGKTWGIAKKCTLIAVKVLNCAGSGSYAGVINGINYVANQRKTRGKRSVANMSLGGPLFQAVNDAVDAAVRADVAMIVAGGNDNNDACKYSPASATLAVTVGATEVQSRSGNQIDLRSSYSNYGTCIDLFAPGTQITSTWINSGTRTISGTSMATPHVAGAAAAYFHKNPTATNDDLLAFLRSNGNQDVIELNCAIAACRASPNILLHSSCDVGI